MLKHIVILTGLACAFVGPALAVGQASAEAVWHCSRQPAPAAEPPGDDFGFGLGAVASGHHTISVTLNDLIAVYSGYPLRVSGKPLFACFMPGDEALSLSALNSMGLNASALQILSRRSAIVQRQLEIVTGEAQMHRCMERNAPAFGYFPTEVINTKVAPCF